MPSDAYFRWIDAGRPWENARPIEQLEGWAGRAGVEVLGTLGDARHLTAVPPEDHTPFSATAWPVPLSGYVVTAIDLADVRELGTRILVDARAGLLPWLKYLNFGGGNYDARRGWAWRANDDQHVHLSIRSDWVSRPIPFWDPFRSRHEEAPDMPIGLAKHPAHPEWYALFSSGGVRHIGPAELKYWRDTAHVPVIPIPANGDGNAEYDRLKAYAAA